MNASLHQDRETEGWAERLADELAGRGVLTDPAWRQAFEEVPRHLFAPARAWTQTVGQAGQAVDAEAGREEWLRRVYQADASVIIQRDEGRVPADGNDGLPTSSLSGPVIVAEFLELLEVRDGHRVLEIGTGSGWTAGLLSQRVGAERVTTVEVDGEVARQAERNLEAAGFAPTVIVGDGAKGWAPGAPYDRVHVTCGVAGISWAWVEQCRVGAVIVLPWQPAGYGGHQLRLRVGRDGRAVGRFHGGCEYMMLRSQRVTWRAHHTDQARTSAGGLDPREVAPGDPGLQLVIAALLPDVIWMAVPNEDGSFSLLLTERGETRAWAACDYDPATGQAEVTQYGDRSLWEETEAAWDRWLSLGSPGRERFGLTLDADGQHLWLDAPSTVIAP